MKKPDESAHRMRIEQKKFYSADGNMRAHCSGCPFRGPWRKTKDAVISDIARHHEGLLAA